MKKFSFVFLTLLAFNCTAHGGRTDSSGGHNCSSKSIAKGLCTGYHHHNSSTKASRPKNYTPELSTPTVQHNNGTISIIRKNTTPYISSSTTQHHSLNKSYNRKDWPHWIDSDRDCQYTRAEILIRDSKEPVQFKRNKGCNVTWGKWLDPYTLKTFTKASDIDIDHIIPLAHAHRNGAEHWSKSQKRKFANDPENLLAVEDNANQQKSAQAPHQWMPSNKRYHCTYLEKWQKLKRKYGLTATSKELNYIYFRLKLCNKLIE